MREMMTPLTPFPFQVCNRWNIKHGISDEGSAAHPRVNTLSSEEERRGSLGKR